MPGTGWVYQSYLEFAFIPHADASVRRDAYIFHLQLIQLLGDALQVMLEPVAKQDGTLRGLNDILQCVQFPVMDVCHGAFVGIHRTVCHLAELTRKGCCIGGSDGFVFQIRKNQILLHGLVLLLFAIIHINRVAVLNKLRHLQMVQGFHGNGDVTNAAIDFFFRKGSRLIGIHDLPVHAVGDKEGISVLGDEPSQSLSHIQALELGKEVHQAIGRWRAGKPHHSLHLGSDLHEGTESF